LALRAVLSQTIDGAGETAHFGPPWSPNEGVLVVSVPDQGRREVVVRFLDEDWGAAKSDDDLGELLLDPELAVETCLADPQGVMRDVPLTLNGRQGYGEVDIAAQWVDEMPELAGSYHYKSSCQHLGTEGSRLLYLRIIEARGLVDKDLLSANDVYCQVYALPEQAAVDSAASALPKLPQPFTELIPQQLSVPFSFQLPEKLPPSMETNAGACIRYSVYSAIDIRWMKNPSTRTFFTVCNRNPIEFLGTTPGQPIHGSSVSRPSVSRCCGLWSLCSRNVSVGGEFHIEVISERRGFAPGEKVRVQIAATNNSSQGSRLRASIVRHFTADTLIRTVQWSRELCSGFEEFDAPAGEKASVVIEMTLPACAATFTGSDTEWMDDVRWLLAHRRGERFAQAEPLKGHPLRWHDRLEVQMISIAPDGPRVTHSIPVTIVSFPPGHDLFRPMAGEPVSVGDIVPGIPLVVAGVVVTFTPDPEGEQECSHPQEDLHCFRPEGLLWAPYCPDSKPEAWPAVTLMNATDQIQ
jgi:hypothetical protein